MSATVGHAVPDHRADDAQLIYEPGNIGKKLTNFDTALPILSELPWRLKKISDLSRGEGERALERERFSVILSQARLRVKRVNV
jgi:hypothetical protein